MVTNWAVEHGRYLECLSLLEWDALSQRLRRKGRFDPKAQRLENFFIGRGVECALDSHGRIMVPSHLRSYASLEKEVVFTASLDGFRMWDKRVWDTVFPALEAEVIEDPMSFAGIDL
jgi:MraZ protein